MLKSFQDIIDQVSSFGNKQTLAIAAAHDEAVVESALRAGDTGLALPLLIGNGTRIRELLRRFDRNPSDYDILEAAEGTEGQQAVDAVNSGDAGILMKGLLDTKQFLGPIVAEKNHLRTGTLMSHLAFFELPGYSKLILHTDGGMVMYPTLDEKKQLIRNAAEALHAMGIDNPSFAIVCAVEKVNPKMKETMDAAELVEMNRSGVITGCTLVGPVSYDIAMSREVADHKGYRCPYVGEFDGMLVPDIQAGNILGKSLIISAKAMMAGIIVGAKAPVIMLSRGATAAEKYNSIALAALHAKGVSA